MTWYGVWQGPFLPDSASGTSWIWDDPGHPFFGDGGSFLTYILSTGATSNDLTCNTFNFNIPSDATIVGFQVVLLRKATGGLDQIHDADIQLLDDTGTPVGDDKADLTTIWTSDQEYTGYGGQTDDWNAVPTPTMLNSTNFGVRISVTNDGALGTAYIYGVWITVYFTRPAGGVPTIESLSAYSGSQYGGDPITIQGTNFMEGAQVFFGIPEAFPDLASDIVVVSNTQITCTTPKHGPGELMVVVINPDGNTIAV